MLDDGSPMHMTVEEFREIARIHYKEASKLLERARAAKAEDRQHEAMLLADLSIAQRERADEYMKAAEGKGGDPILEEIMDGLQEQRDKFSLQPGQVLEPVAEPLSSKLGDRIARALSWVAQHEPQQEKASSAKPAKPQP